MRGAKDGFAQRAARAGDRAARPRRRSGIDRLLDVHRRGVPLPARPRADHGDRQGRRGEGAAERRRPGRSTAFVFKTVSDPFVGHITMFRVFSGHGPPGLVACTTRRRAPTSASASCSRCGARSTRSVSGGRGRRHRRGGEAAAHAHRRHVRRPRTTRCSCRRSSCPSRCWPTRSRRRPRATRTSSSTGLARLREEDPTLARRAHRRDARDRDVRDGRGAPRGA